MLYVTSGVCTGHFRRNLMPETRDISSTSVWRVMSVHLRLEERGDGHGHSYNVLQRFSYLAVVLVVTPLMIWTGMAMSPAVVSVFPFFATSLGGHQTARTLHFFAAVFLVLFLFCACWHGNPRGLCNPDEEHDFWSRTSREPERCYVGHL
jgi:thiosulfate reductase cytochrome b subunit